MVSCECALVDNWMLLSRNNSLVNRQQSGILSKEDSSLLPLPISGLPADQVLSGDDR